MRLETNASTWFRLIVRVMLLAGCLALAAAMVPDQAPDGDAEASLDTP